MTNSRFKRPHAPDGRPLADMQRVTQHGAHPSLGVRSGDNVSRRDMRLLRAMQSVLDGQSSMEQMPSAFSFMPRPTRVFRPAGITPAAQQAPQTTANPVQVRWPQDCFVVGITFGTLEGTAAALGAMSVRIQVEGSLDVFTDGQAGAFAHVGSLANSATGMGVAGFFPFIRWATQTTAWQVTVKNEDPVAGGTPFTPVVQFLIVDPRDLDQLLAQSED